MNPKKVAITLGIMFGVFYTACVIAVRNGFFDYWNKMHMTTFQYTIDPWSWTLFVQGVVIEVIIGIVIGWLFATVWNWVDEKVK